MAVDAVKNFAYSTVAPLGAPSPSTSGIHLIVQTGDGSKFPAGTFDATAWPVGQLPTLANSEIMRCTVAGDTFTLTRGQYGTTPQPIAVGYQIAQTVTANLVAEIVAAIAAAVQQPVGSLYFNTSVATNPATLLGYGTWAAFAQGQCLIGVGTSDQVFGIGNTGGESKHTLLEAENGQHKHNGSTASSSVTGSTTPSTTTGGGTVSGATTTANVVNTGGDNELNHHHQPFYGGGFLSWSQGANPVGSLGPAVDMFDAGTFTATPDTQHDHLIPSLPVNAFNVPNLTIPSLSFTATPTVVLSLANDPASATSPHNNLQPYIVVYIWVRTA